MGADRDKMLENLRGRDVLDAAKNPLIRFRGRYAGTLDEGKLTGDLTLRGTPRAVIFPIRITRDETSLRAVGAWEGPLTALGIKPFKALLGALKLEDWAKIRLDLRFDRKP